MKFRQSLHRKVDRLMATVADISTGLDELAVDLATGLADIKGEITALQAVAANPTALDPLLAKVTALDATVKAADPGPQTTAAATVNADPGLPAPQPPA